MKYSKRRNMLKLEVKGGRTASNRIRKLDDLRGVVIPKELQKTLNINGRPVKSTPTRTKLSSRSINQTVSLQYGQGLEVFW